MKKLAFIFGALIALISSENVFANPPAPCDPVAAVYNNNGYTCTPDPYVGTSLYWCSGGGSSWALAVGSTGRCQAFEL